MFSSDGWAFEFADLTSAALPVISGPPLRVPEPASLVLLGVVRFQKRRSGSAL